MNKILVLITFFLASFLGISQENSKKVECLSNRLTVVLPNYFYKMPDSLVNIKYPYGNKKPQEVYTEKLGKINFTTSLRANKMPIQRKHLAAVKNILLNELKEANTIKQHKLIELSGKPFILLEFVSKGLDKKIYNMLYASNLNGKLIIGNFNFPNEEYSIWYKKGKATIYSIKIL